MPSYPDQAPLISNLDNHNLFAVNPEGENEGQISTEFAALSLSGSVNVKSFGVKGDGVTDDTEKLQDAIDSLSINGNRKLFVPPGDYNISSALVIKVMGTQIIGDSWATTTINQTDSTANVFEWPNADQGVTTIADIRLQGQGAGISTGSGVYSRRENGDFYMSDVRLLRVKIFGFKNCVWGENLPKLISDTCHFGDFEVGFRLSKCDTFQINNTSCGSRREGVNSTAFVIEGSEGTPAGRNFGGIIDLGEYGDIDHFLHLTNGTVAVRQPNLERVQGDYVVKIGQGGILSWEGGRIANTVAVGVQSFFTLDASANTFLPQVYFYGSPQFAGDGWRAIEIFGASNYDAGVSWFGSSSPEAVYASTEGGDAVSSFNPNPFISRRLTSAMPAGESTYGRIYHYTPADSLYVPSALLMSGRDVDNSYKLQNLVNDGLMRVPLSTVSDAGTVGAAETTLLQVDYDAFSVPAAGWSMNVKAFGQFAANSNNKNLKVDAQDFFVLFDTGSVAVNGKDWALDITIVMIHGSASRAIVTLQCDDALVSETVKITPSLSRGYTQDSYLKIKGTGVDDDDVNLLYAKQSVLKAGSAF